MNNNSITTSIKVLDNNKVKLTVEVDEQEFDSAVDAAFKRIAREVRIPGFRRGKVPRRILEAQLGHESGRSEALREELPTYYHQAVVRHEIDVIDSPDIEIVAGAQQGAVVFDATVEVRPVVELVGYHNLRIEVPDPQATDEDLDAEIARLRAEHAEFQLVERPVQDGDQVNINIVGTHEGEELPGLTASDYDYEVGTAAVVAAIDENLRGASAGDVLKFDAPHPDEEVPAPINFVVDVLAVKEAVLPELDDDWVAAVSEFATLDELCADIVAELDTTKFSLARQAAELKIAEELAALVTDEIPKVMVDDEIYSRLQATFRNLQRSGIEPYDYLTETGQDIDQLRNALAGPAENAVKVDLALRAIAEAKELNPDADELVQTMDETAKRLGTDGAAEMKRFKDSGQIQSLRADIGKSRALEWLFDNVEIVDETGAVVDLKPPESSLDGVTDQDDPATDHGEAK